MVGKFKSEMRDMRNISLSGIIVAAILCVAIVFSFGQ